MRLQDLSAQQLRNLLRQLNEKLAYIKKLHARMEATNFPKFDRVYRDIGMVEALLRDAIYEIDTMLGFRGR